jgi:hypothetical protein
MELTRIELGKPAWWSFSLEEGDRSVTRRPSEDAIKKFRNESSLSCLCAALIRSSPIPTQLENQSEVLIWDPFVGNGSVVLETIQFIADHANSKSRNVTIVGNVKSPEVAKTIIERIKLLVAARGAHMTIVDDIIPESTENRSGGRKGRRVVQKSDQNEATDMASDDAKIQSMAINCGPMRIQIQLTTVGFQEIFPYIQGACILTHIPKSYTELVGIDKNELSGWSSFGNWIKSCSPKTLIQGGITVLSETNSFYKYSKLRMTKLIHLKSPTGRSVGSIARWIGF